MGLHTVMIMPLLWTRSGAYSGHLSPCGHNVVYSLVPYTRFSLEKTAWKRASSKMKTLCQGFPEGTDSICQMLCSDQKMCIWWQNQNFLTIHLRPVCLMCSEGYTVYVATPRKGDLIQNAVFRLLGKWMLKAFPVIAAVWVIAKWVGEQRLSRNISALPPSPAACPWHLETGTSMSS